MKEAAKNTTLFDWENFEDFDVKRQFSKLSIIGTAKLPKEEIKQVSKGMGYIPIIQKWIKTKQNDLVSWLTGCFGKFLEYETVK